MSVNQEMLRGSTAVLVLSMLDREPMYGYQMIKEIEQESGGIFLFKEGTLYPILHALESKGMIESYWLGKEGGRKRKYYQLTTKGKAHLKEQQQEWVRFRGAVDKILKREVLAWI
ncbi:PadR family transcriptional regulator [Dehalobacterium formicoaceticum]|uniref:Helix-turn-helix transcriptional regulator n=1 Tax=Dehalobacterium formicoaceticum TaxID=51515 RepID=A0ABT1Y212_9FIRM|nr:helix-turn-helix transcriptional regulator [Dehalobacterium formicoaceticum]MCR6544890.1 helix-turn-helix transcriptional regulator [Dehalobacterium formicoaceticum]